MQREAQDGREPGRRHLPVHQDAARGGAGDVQDGGARRHLHDELISDLVAADPIVHLACVVPIVNHLQIRQHQVAALEYLGIVENSLAQLHLIFEPFAARLARSHARERHARAPSANDWAAERDDFGKHSVRGDGRHDLGAFPLADTCRRRHPELVFDVRLQPLRLVIQRLRRDVPFVVIHLFSPVQHACVQVVFDDVPVRLCRRHPQHVQRSGAAHNHLDVCRRFGS